MEEGYFDYFDTAGNFLDDGWVRTVAHAGTAGDETMEVYLHSDRRKKHRPKPKI